MNQEEAEAYLIRLEQPLFKLEDLVRASVREELDEMVEKGLMSREEVDSYQEEMVGMRMRHFLTSSLVSAFNLGSLDTLLDRHTEVLLSLPGGRESREAVLQEL